MKKSYRFIAVISSLIICAAAFSACSGGENENSSDASSAKSSSSYDNSENQISNVDESKDSESKVDESSNGESDISSETQSQEEDSETTEGSEENSEPESSMDNEQNSNNASDAQNPSESSSSTGNEDFDNIFKNNKLDVALTEEMKLAETTEAMVETMTKYERLWLAEAENANSKLQESSLSDSEKQSIQSDYDKWVNNFTSKRQEIIDEEKSKWNSGSIYIINAAERIKDYCRDYAMGLYEKLYSIDGSFELAYSE